MEYREEIYAPGNVELLKSFNAPQFDKAAALRILTEIPNLNQPILNLGGFSSTYLFEAQTRNNVEAVRLLLENGADPNLYIPNITNDCALTDLHFLWDEMESDVPKRLEVAKLFFDFGGDPNLDYDGESLYDHVLWEIFNDEHTPHDWKYLCSFFKILIAYGGGGGRSHCPKPKLTEPIDKNRIDEYDFHLFRCEDGYHLEGHIFNPDNVDIGIV